MIDPFSQKKTKIKYDIESANRINFVQERMISCFVPSQSFTVCSPENFSQGNQ